MDRFIEILREEFEKRASNETEEQALSIIMITFDKACIHALVRYAKEKGISLD